MDIEWTDGEVLTVIAGEKKGLQRGETLGRHDAKME